jgi:hypothetical protein
LLCRAHFAGHYAANCRGSAVAVTVRAACVHAA